MIECLLKDCNEVSVVRGLCRNHYNQLVKNSLITHGIRGGLLEDSPTWKSWDNIKERCRKVSSKKYPKYGGAGIDICQGWHDSAKKFFHDLGPRPINKTIDRIDNDGGYWCGECEQCIENNWPMNCKWSTKREQNLNKKIKNKHGYPGVRKKGNKFEARIGFAGGKKKYLGTFNTAEEAGAAYMGAFKIYNS